MSTPVTPFIDLRPDRTKTYAAFKPILDRILVRCIDRTTQGFFDIPDKFRQPSKFGEVLAVGDSVVLGRECFPLTNFVNIGDIVRFSEFSAEPLEPDANSDNRVLPGRDYIIRIQDVRGVESLQHGK